LYLPGSHPIVETRRGEFRFTSHPKQGKSIGGAISPDLELFQTNKKTPVLPLLTNTSKRLNLFLLIPEERKKVNS
jgi:hypothetical protein